MKTKKEEVKQEVQLQEAFHLWKNKAKSGIEYLTGKDLHEGKLVGYFNTNKKNPKEPDVRVYEVDSEGKTGKEVASLWESISKEKETRYLTGTTDENEKLVAFYGNKEKVPYIKAYFKN